MNKSSMSTKTTTGAENGGQEAVLDQAKHAVTNVAAQARDQVSNQLSTQFDSRKDKAVETIGNVADAIRGTSDKLKGVGPLGDVAERAADGIQSVATFFEGKQIGDIVRDANRFARREPALFLGAAFAIGLIGGRFLKSSAPRETGGSPAAYARQGGGTYDRYEAAYDASYDDAGYDDSFVSDADLESELSSYGARTSSSRKTGPAQAGASARRNTTATQGSMSQGSGFGTTPTTAKPETGTSADKGSVASSSPAAATYGTSTSKTDTNDKSGT